MASVLLHRDDGKVVDITPPHLEGDDFVRDRYAKLGALRYNYHDEVPQEIIHSTSPDIRYKCRVAWWAIMDFWLGSLDTRGLLPEHLSQKYQLVMEEYRRTAGDVSAMPSNIQHANELLDAVMGELESRARTD